MVPLAYSVWNMDLFHTKQHVRIRHSVIERDIEIVNSEMQEFSMISVEITENRCI
jgi:hypothetical protein